MLRLVLVFSSSSPPKALTRIEVNGDTLTAHDYVWDGRRLCLNTPPRGETSLRLVFSEDAAPSRIQAGK